MRMLGIHLCDLKLFVDTIVHVQSSGDTEGSEGGSVLGGGCNSFYFS